MALWPIPGSVISFVTGGTSVSEEFPPSLFAEADYIAVSTETEDASWRTGKGATVALVTDPYAIKTPMPPQIYRKLRGHDTVAAITSGGVGVFKAWLLRDRA